MKINKSLNRLDKLTKAHVFVIGDVMLDKYIFGSVSRISPEAPVPVLRTEKERETLGGAANVAHNIAMLKAECSLLGTAGNDQNRDTVAAMLDKLKVDTTLVGSGQRTTTKIRVIGEQQQIVRIDYEDILNPSPEIYQILTKNINEKISAADVVVISDYGKGLIFNDLCRDVIKKSNKAGKITVVDPKGADWSKYSGATIITPNVKELGEAAGHSLSNTDRAITEAGRKIREKYGLKYLVVTRSEKGITIIAEKLVTHLPTQAQEVYDVSGAGDTVVGTLACALGGGFAIEEAVAVANAAAGVVVSKIGTVPITYTELLRACSGKENGTAVPLEQLLGWLNEFREGGRKIVFTNGCFDILHRGHVDYLRKARKLGDLLVVGLNSDESTGRLKGPSRPINKQEDRAFMLEALECVDYVVIFNEDTPYELLAQIKPDVLVKGGDYKPDQVIGREFAGEVAIIDFVNGYSTTSIIENVKRGKNK